MSFSTSFSGFHPDTKQTIVQYNLTYEEFKSIPREPVTLPDAPFIVLDGINDICGQYFGVLKAYLLTPIYNLTRR